MELTDSNQGVPTAWLRLVSLWVLAETVLGGLLHGLKLPVTGLLAGGSAMLCIMLISWHFPQKGSVLKAMVLVLLMKFSLSPHSPFPAYLAVFFQGITGEFLLRGRRFFAIKCLLFAFTGMMESALQRLLVMVFISGTEIWDALDLWARKVSSGLGPERLSLWLAAAYLLFHAIAGLFLGWLGWKLVSEQSENLPLLKVKEAAAISIQKKKQKKNQWAGKVLSVLALGVYLLQFFPLIPAIPDLPALVFLLLRMVWMYGLLVYLLVPVLGFFLKKVLAEKVSSRAQTLEQIRNLLPEVLALARAAWQHSRKGVGFLRLLVFNILYVNEENHDSYGSEGAG